MSVISTLRQKLPLLLSYDGRSTSILPFLPKPLRIVLLLLLIINSRSLPFNWHIRVFRPIVYLRLQWWATLMPLRSKAKRRVWLESLSPVGSHPFKHQTRFKSWASPDDSDFNLHLSNSSYAKTLDAARLKSAIECFTGFFRDGGWIALGATHYHFIREIPMFANYEVRITILTWDQKWIFLLAKYVSHPKRKTLKAKESRNGDNTPGSRSSPLPIPSFHTPANEDSISSSPGSSTPARSSSTPSLATLLNTPEPDGATLHCIALSQCCYKIGRVTVPPSLVLGASGFCLTKDSKEWQSVCEMRNSQPKGKGKQGDEMRAFLRGGWKELDPADRWWDKALGGEIEATRARNWEVAKKIKEGIEGVRTL